MKSQFLTPTFCRNRRKDPALKTPPEHDIVAGAGVPYRSGSQNETFFRAEKVDPNAGRTNGFLRIFSGCLLVAPLALTEGLGAVLLA